MKMGENHFYKKTLDLKGCPICDIEGDPILSIRSNSFFERWGGECQNCGFVMDGFLKYEDLIRAWGFLSKGFESTTIGDAEIKPQDSPL